jgi:hypothetical protein
MKWKTRLVASATTLLLLAVSFGGGCLEVIRNLYLDW